MSTTMCYKTKTSHTYSLVRDMSINQLRIFSNMFSISPKIPDSVSSLFLDYSRTSSDVSFNRLPSISLILSAVSLLSLDTSLKSSSISLNNLELLSTISPWVVYLSSVSCWTSSSSFPKSVSMALSRLEIVYFLASSSSDKAFRHRSTPSCTDANNYDSDSCLILT